MLAAAKTERMNAAKSFGQFRLRQFPPALRSQALQSLYCVKQGQRCNPPLLHVSLMLPLQPHIGPLVRCAPAFKKGQFLFECRGQNSPTFATSLCHPEGIGLSSRGFLRVDQFLEEIKRTNLCNFRIAPLGRLATYSQSCYRFAKAPLLAHQ